MSEPESYIKPEILLGSETPPAPVAYNKRDLILYALGVGATDLRYVYEGGTIILIFSNLFEPKKLRIIRIIVHYDFFDRIYSCNN